MRTDPAVFAVRNLAAAKAPRFVIKIEFAASSLYLSSHGDLSGVPVTHIPSCIIEPSISSQKLNPDQGRAEIGAASFTVADKDSAFTVAVRDKLAAGEGLRGKLCRFYLGFEGMAWADFVLVGTQTIKEVAYERGSYRVSCNDVQRAARKDIFELAATTIASTVEATDTTINVASTAGFTRLKHGTSYTDAASSTVGYIKIKDEVIRYTGTTSTSFTGCTRGVLGTEAARYVADGATPASRREKVSEYVYLELPGPKLAYAILTGVLHGDSANLPDSWHLGIPTSLVRLADFTGIGTDLWNTSDDAAGVVLRFEGLSKTDGKAFIELELLRLMGLFAPVYADGALGLRRMTRVLADASGVVTLDESNSVTVGDLEHDMEALHNAFSVYWNWNGKDYTRTTTYLDATSVAAHGRSSTMEIKVKGLYGGRHTDAAIFKLLDQIRDRYSSPPVRLRVEVLHSLNRLEVGDVVRVRHRMLRDFNTADEHIDRAFEVQSVTVNHRTGAVSLDLFGSTSTATSIKSPTGATSALPDAFYTAQGTNLTGVMTISGGVVSGGPYTLAGTTDLTASGSTWYYNGDLTIPEGVTVNITGNVQLRVKGYLTINGTINGVGDGWAGVADNGTTTVIDGNPGWVGNSRGTDGVARVNITDSNVTIKTQPCAITQAQHASFPYMQLEVVGSALKGLPTDLRGTGGGPGGKVVHENGTFYANGGTGGTGGSGLCTISRGLGLGANARIDLSGNDTAAVASYNLTHEGKNIAVFPGTGGAGGPGSYLCLIDGGLLSVPDLGGRFVARTGAIGVPAIKTALSGTAPEKFKPKLAPFGGYITDPSVISSQDYSFSAQRIQYIPAPETPSNDGDTLAPVTGVTISQNSSGFVVSFTPATGTPAGAIFEVWQHSSSSPFSSATKIAEGAATVFFIPRANTTTVYIWVRARWRPAVGATIYSTQTPAGNGLPAAAISTAGTYATATPSSVSGVDTDSSITTAAITADLVGATPTTYSWTRQSGSTAISANSASSATTTFTASPVGTGQTVSAVFRCTINGTYTVDVAVDCTNIGSAMVVSAAPSTVSKTQDAATITTAAAAVSVAGGSGGYSYAWTKVSGGSISITSATSASTTFSASTMTAGESRSAVMRCTVTDSNSDTATVDVSVTITRQGMSVSLSPTAVNKFGSTSGLTTAGVTATPAGGVAPYTYAWTKQSGDAITANSPAAASTTFTATGLSLDEERSAVFRLTCTDSTPGTPLTATRDITVTITRYSFN